MYFVSESRDCPRVRRSCACCTLTTWFTWGGGPGMGSESVSGSSGTTGGTAPRSRTPQCLVQFSQYVSILEQTLSHPKIVNLFNAESCEFYQYCPMIMRLILTISWLTTLMLYIKQLSIVKSNQTNNTSRHNIWNLFSCTTYLHLPPSSKLNCKNWRERGFLHNAVL